MMCVNPVWKSIWESWASVNYHIPTKGQIRAQVIWCNSHIKINRKTLLNTKMYKCGIIYVENIYNFVEKTFMTYEQARYEYGDFGSFIEYYAVIKAIPIEWKTLLRG